MDLVSRWISALAFLPSAFVYVYTLQRRVENRKRTGAGIVLFLVLCGFAAGIWPPGNPADLECFCLLRNLGVSDLADLKRSLEYFQVAVWYGSDRKAMA